MEPEYPTRKVGRLVLSVHPLYGGRGRLVVGTAEHPNCYDDSW